MQEILLQIRYFERALSKSLKKLTFLSSLVPFSGQDYEKQITLQFTKQVQKDSVISDVLPDKI